MFGGVFSALAVGAILNSKQSYGRVIADSYIEEGKSDEFWDNLSEEDRIKAEELLGRLRESKNGANKGGEDTKRVFEKLIDENTKSTSKVDIASEVKSSEPVKKEKVSMFSDYDD